MTTPTQPNNLNDGPGKTWIWPHRTRWLLTTKPFRPKSTSIHEQGRCGIIGDYPTFEHAKAGARRHRIRVENNPHLWA